MEKEKKETKLTIKKNKEGYGYTYTDLAEINKYCEENGITYYQETETSELNGEDYIITYVNDGTKVEKHRGCKIVQATLSGIKNPVQEYGSSLTYCRRYSLLMALGLATEDTDAQELTMPSITTIEEAKAYKLTWGKHAGKTLGEIDESYLHWLMDNSKDETIKTACDFIINHTTQQDIDIEAEYQRLLLETDTDREKLYEHYGVENDTQMTEEQIKEAIEIMRKKVK